jgi:Ni2+-binding GTPase involved in maturation of urease and hydrogenase
MTGKARYILIGGFLGAGKTTAVLRLAGRLRERGLRVGLIANDQGTGLVDSGLMRSGGFPVEEIGGGCFCCRFTSLVEASRKLAADARPDALIAEPVGSCTDLVSTVSEPLRRMYGDDYAVAPFSVLVDPVRALRILGVESGPRFSETVTYIYRTQLAEADLIVVNKIDLLDEARRAALRDVLRVTFPRAELFEVSARRGDGLDAWFERVLAEPAAAGTAVDVDYRTYGDGEERLGWLNAEIDAAAKAPFDGNALLKDLAARIRGRVGAGGGEIAHLKMILDPGGWGGDVAALSVVGSDREPTRTHALAAPIGGGRLVVNLRAEAPPELLRSALDESIAGAAAAVPGLALPVRHLQAFKPGRPKKPPLAV